MAFNVEVLVAQEDRIPPEGRKRITNLVEFERNIKRPAEPEIPDNVWKLIQLCCGEDPKRRPTMDEVVMEMERWALPPLAVPQNNVPPEAKTGSKPKDSSYDSKSKSTKKPTISSSTSKSTPEQRSSSAAKRKPEAVIGHQPIDDEDDRKLSQSSQKVANPPPANKKQKKKNRMLLPFVDDA
ncbi:hypothetical protein JOM56_015065 [Amanita muscaria]